MSLIINNSISDFPQVNFIPILTGTIEYTDYSISSSGQYQLFCANKRIFKSSNHGLSWTEALTLPSQTTNTDFPKISVYRGTGFNDGKYQIIFYQEDIFANQNFIYYSKNYGLTFTKINLLDFGYPYLEPDSIAKIDFPVLQTNDGFSLSEGVHTFNITDGNLASISAIMDESLTIFDSFSYTPTLYDFEFYPQFVYVLYREITGLNTTSNNYIKKFQSINGDYSQIENFEIDGKTIRSIDIYENLIIGHGGLSALLNRTYNSNLFNQTISNTSINSQYYFFITQNRYLRRYLYEGASENFYYYTKDLDPYNLYNFGKLLTSKVFLSPYVFCSYVTKSKSEAGVIISLNNGL